MISKLGLWIIGMDDICTIVCGNDLQYHLIPFLFSWMTSEKIVP